MLKSLEKSSIGYDTSSYCNINEYETNVIEAVRRGALFTRLTCFAPGKNEEMRNWFLTLMDSQFDKSNQYSKLREAMKKGCVNVWHYPLEMATDYLIVEKNGKPDSAIIGFCTGEDVKRHLVYNAGIYLANKEACEDLVELYGLLVLKAKEHLLEQENKSPNERCICYNFLDRKTKTLLPS